MYLPEYKMTIEVGRIHEWHKYIFKEFDSEKELYKDLRNRLQERRRHNYELVEASQNFPFSSLLTGFPHVDKRIKEHLPPILPQAPLRGI